MGESFSRRCALEPYLLKIKKHQARLSATGKKRSVSLEHFQFETLCVSNHTACRFAEKAQFFRSLWAGRRCAAASRFTFFKVETL
ncbi:hypothetical protein QUW15_08740 [Desulfovibrio piger]|nr:hypothetical protein [Desulfovibrio piger]